MPGKAKLIHTLINQHRIEKKLAPLKWSLRLARSARAHSMNMARRIVPVGHHGFKTRLDRLIKKGRYRMVGENVAYNFGYAKPASQAFQQWLNSPGHRANLEQARYRLTGISVVRSQRGHYYFPQLFAEPL